jgi:hypothetical protein
METLIIMPLVAVLPVGLTLHVLVTVESAAAAVAEE